MSSPTEHSSLPNASTRKLRRPRPNTYAALACERCRARKQRCLVDTDDDQACRNCADSGSECVFLPRPEKVKRTRNESQGSVLSLDDPEDPVNGSPPRSFYPQASSLPDAVPQQSFVSNAADTLLGARSSGTPAGWLEWNSLRQGPMPTQQPSQYDWNVLLTTLTQQAATLARAQTQSRPQSPPQTQRQSPPQQLISEPPDCRPSVSPTAESDGNSVFEAARGLAMISLEAAAEPHYVGESSGTLWTTLLSKGVHRPRQINPNKGRPRHTSRSPSPARLVVLRSQMLKPLSEETAQLVLDTTYQHLHSRYPFMDWLTFEKQWQARDQLLLAVARDKIPDKETGVAAYFVLMILAIGAQYCKAQHLSGLLDPYDYYTLAQPYLRHIVQLHNLANVQGLLLLAIFSLRDTRGPSVWYISGVTIRLCIGLGLHRARTPRNISPYIAELRKRIFWTCYTLDRMVSLLLGRPHGISDDDIDAELPVVESGLEDNRSMASAVHYIRLVRLESKIQRAVFPIGRRKEMTTADVYLFLQAIGQWESEIPVESTMEDRCLVPCCTKDWFLLRAVEAKLHLLRPLCQDEGETAQTFLPQLAQIAAQGCELQKRTHLLGAPPSNVQLHSTFICGLTLVYAVFLQSKILPLTEVFAAIKAASNTLFAYSNHNPTAGPLFEVYEELSAACLDRISRDDRPQPAEGAKAWQKASNDAANSLASESSVEYADLFRALGIEMDTQPSSSFDEMWNL